MRSGSVISPDIVRAPGALDDRVPVTVLTGFLGAGKTTLLNRVLGSAAGPRTLVIVNEFGDAGLDHALMAHAHDEGVIELAGGCVCCSQNGDLGRTLADAIWRFSRQGQRDFDRVVIETTGLATPESVTAVMHRDFRVAAHYRLHGVVTVVDVLNVLDARRVHSEVTRQVGGADRVVLAKGDLVEAPVLEAVSRWVRSINPVADVVDASCPEPFELAVGAWRAGVFGVAPSAPSHGDMPTVSIAMDSPVDERAFAAWIDLLIVTAGASLLRLKGIIYGSGADAPLVIQAVQGVAHPAVRLGRDEGGARQSRLVLIGHALRQPAVLGLLEAAQALFPRCVIERRGGAAAGP